MLFVTTDDFNFPPYDLPAQLLDGATFAPYVDKQIKKELVRILGSTLYNFFIAAYNASIDPSPVPLPTRWQKLVDGDVYIHNTKQYAWAGMHDAFVPFVFAMWMKHNVDNNTTNGVIVSKAENSEVVSSGRRIVTGFNEYCFIVGDVHHPPHDTLVGYLWNSGDTFLDLITSEYADIKAYLRDRTKWPTKMNIYSL